MVAQYEVFNTGVNVDFLSVHADISSTTALESKSSCSMRNKRYDFVFKRDDWKLTASVCLAPVFHHVQLLVDAL